MRSSVEDNHLIIYLEGRIDSKNTYEIETEILGMLESSELEPVFDLADLKYISSAGLRILMKVRKLTGQSITIREVSPEIYEILETTGFSELFNVSKRLREISIEGCELIGKGFFGTVYRIDEDTIVKVYDHPDSIAMIKNEKEMAKLAFINGIPTAISYDIVKVGDSYGSVFEMLNARSFNDIMIEEPENNDETLTKYVKLLKEVHETQIEDDRLPSAKKRHFEYLEKIESMISNEQSDRLKELLGSIPESICVVHGDCQMKNVLMVDDEPMLIDMDTLSVGNKIFDLAGLYVAYVEFLEDEPDNSMIFMGLTSETSLYIWDTVLKKYFDGESEDSLKEIEDKIRLVAAIRFLYILTLSDRGNDELHNKRVVHTREHIDELCGRLKDLII